MATNNPTNFPILDEDDLISDSATSLATQQSIKAYVDNNLPRKNLIIGGNFSTNPWQRGTSFTTIGNGAYSADRFFRSGSNDGAFSHLKTTDSPTVAESGVRTEFCLECDVTTADPTLAAGQYESINYRMEGYDFQYIAQQGFTLSFWVKASRADTYCVGFSNSGSDRSYVAEYAVNSIGVWQKIEITVPASPSAGTWNYTNGYGLQIWFTLGAGTTWQTTAGSWQTGFFFATSNQVNGIAATSDYLRIALVQVERGSSATPFEVRHEQTELALCQRYFYKTFNQGVAPATGVGAIGIAGYRTYIAGAFTTLTNVNFPVKMRTTPTFTFYNPTNANTNWYNFTVAADSGPSAVGSNGDGSLGIQNIQVAGDTASSNMGIHFTATAEL